MSQSLVSTDKNNWLAGSYEIVKRDAVDVLIINHPKFECEISLFGGHILTFKPLGLKEVLWFSEQANFDGRNALRGGIPICWPWFGNHHDGAPNKKSHGFARTSVWQLNKLTSNAERAHLELLLTQNAETLKVFPYHFELKLLISLSDSLKISLIATNSDSSTFSFTGALHTYFKVSDIKSARIYNLGTECRSSVDNGTLIQVTDPFVLSKALDYVFPNTGKIVLQVADNTHISSTNADSWVVWNPWQEGAQSIQDMPDNEFHSMLCIEPAIISKPITLNPLQSYRLDLCIK